MRPELAEDARFSSYQARLENQDALYGIIGEWSKTMGAEELVEVLSGVDVPASALMSIADIVADHHYQERGTFVPVDDEEHGELLVMAPMPKMSGTPGNIRSLGPDLGAHNAEVYGEYLGLTEEALASLEKEGVI